MDELNKRFSKNQRENVNVEINIVNQRGQTIDKKLKKKRKVQNSNNVCNGNKSKKEPLPMKLRALPESFWQQPNKMLFVSPGSEFSFCCSLEKEDTVLSFDNRSNLEETLEHQNGSMMSDANTELLFSLFRKVEEDQNNRTTENSKPKINKRGRPKKPKAYGGNVIRDDDPYLASGIAESLLPFLPVKSNPESLQAKIAASQQVLAMVSNDVDSSLNNNNVNDHNYSQILSELVVKL